MPDPVVELVTGGKAYRGWESIKLSRSLTQVASSFELEVTDALTPRSWRTPKGAPSEIRIDDARWLTGYIDDVEIDDDETDGPMVKLVGRDVAGDLVDCSPHYKPGTWKNKRIDHIGGLVAPFGLTFEVDGDPGEPLEWFSHNPGDTAADTLGRLVRIRGYLLTCTPDGKIVAVRAGTERASAELRRGDNILRGATASFSDRDRFSVYTVLGQSSGSGDWLSGKDTSQIERTAEDPKFKRFNRYRPMTVQAGTGTATPEQLQQRADWEAAVRRGKSEEVTYPVHGWYDDAGALWDVNKIIHVDDPMFDIHGDRLITRVQLTITPKQGARARLTVMPPEALTPRPIPDPESEESDSWL